MKILIVENEIYLSQSIATKLGELGYVCDTVSTIADALLKEEYYNVVLLSTNISGQNFQPVIDAFANSVIILMIAYVSNDTVTKPLKAGANDYILKPFMIEELVHKIEHFQDYEALKRQNLTFKHYIIDTFKSSTLTTEESELNLPVMIVSNYQKSLDAYAFEYMSKKEEECIFISLTDKSALADIAKVSKNEIAYVTHFQTLKRSDQVKLMELVDEKKIILSSTEHYSDKHNLDVITLEQENVTFDHGDIMPIEDYVKYIILNFQDHYPDTELSKKLGISRKSLWEKRKKYGLLKKK